MKAIITTKHGPPDVLQLQEVEKPTPKPDELLIKVHAATVTSGDIVLRNIHPLLSIPMRLFGVRRKSTPGHEFAGEVQAVGKDITRFKVGDQVFGTTTGLTVGANAEYVVVPETSKSSVLARKPANLSYQEAAAVPVGGMTAFQILQRANIQPGQRVLINGASGSVGTYAVQLAKQFGAEVTGVTSAKNLDWVKELGADHVIDYKKEDFTTNGRTYHVIFDTVGKSSAEKSKPALTPDGRFLTTQTTTKETAEYLATLTDLLQSGHLKPIIDRTYPLAKTAEAHRYVETGRKKGNIVITITQ
jgi:NADPH:quinone reductase-like Zn-dependent oxidoreductase